MSLHFLKLAYLKFFIIQLWFQTKVFAFYLALLNGNYFRKNTWESEESLKETAQEAIAKWTVDKVKKAEKDET